MDGLSVLLVAVPTGLLLLTFVLKRTALEFWRLRTELFAWMVVSAGLSLLARSIDQVLVEAGCVIGESAVAAVSVRAFRRVDRR